MLVPGCGLTLSDPSFTFTLLNLPWTQYHIKCQGLFEKPPGRWFCDDEAKKNAGWQVLGTRKRRRRVIDTVDYTSHMKFVIKKSSEFAEIFPN